jgi:ABC-type multidrug transport system fused ATPase/permease subunit
VHLAHSTASGGEHAGAAAAADTNVSIFNSLSYPISEGGLNLSQGQRQLLCLACIIISRPKIMVFDEATSAVDMNTDASIQRTIQKEFTDSTLLVIAHRLGTIADFDRILVMSEGRAVEFGASIDLLREQGAFWNMVKGSGERIKFPIF